MSCKHKTKDIMKAHIKDIAKLKFFLTKKQVKRLKELYKAGVTISELARMFNVEHSAIRYHVIPGVKEGLAYDVQKERPGFVENSRKKNKRQYARKKYLAEINMLIYKED